jgi:DNA-directed RNA polymerase subunit F
MKGPSSTPPSSGASPNVPLLADAPPHDVAEEASTHGRSSRAGLRGHPGPGPSTPELSTADGAGDSNIDQLREIIFGGQLREYERRFARMEAGVAKELADVREEVRARCTALEKHLRDELESVMIELRTVQQSRAAEERRLSQSILDAAKGAEDRIAALADLVTRENRDLRAQLREQTKAITDDVQRRHADLLALSERSAAELRDGKAGRTDLSALLMEVALRLRGESVIPESAESSRD